MSNDKVPAYRRQAKFKLNPKFKGQIPPTPPLLNGGEGGLLIDFGI